MILQRNQSDQREVHEDNLSNKQQQLSFCEVRVLSTYIHSGKVIHPLSQNRINPLHIFVCVLTVSSNSIEGIHKDIANYIEFKIFYRGSTSKIMSTFG